MSLWADYIKEKYNKEMIEEEDGFVTYLIYPPNKEFYIEDIYVRPEKRRAGSYISLMRKIGKIARDNGCDKISCYVFLPANNPEDSIKWILKVGFKVSHATPDNKLFFVLNLEGSEIEEFFKNER